ncbi:SoxW family protein [Pseudodonghicola flavimaris]|uniref:Thioredoxin family protein n=1 Tax=Pseudodonghicola flavimaris TaxID=3050036 RepID=A0ABT7EYV8_9RHOB|nr:thioredoxin family protein [Pseudodonghicola flavimaris]MDK3017544.1 thioredoxin family protein [Pseudodonghicola flavimaris]
MFKAILAAAAAVLLAVPLSAAELGDDGLHKEDWMRETFKDLREDFHEAQGEGKRLMIILEQRGCIYCKEMHEKTFPDPRIRALLKDRYFPVQMNLHGDTEIVDTDGEALSEKAAARKWRILFTPTMIFFPTELDESRPAIDQAVAVMPGAFSPGTTFDMLTWVLEERYEDQSEEDFQRYHARMIRERADGKTD